MARDDRRKEYMWGCVEYGGHLGYPRRFLGKVTEGTDLELRRQILAGDRHGGGDHETHRREPSRTIPH